MNGNIVECREKVITARKECRPKVFYKGQTYKGEILTLIFLRKFLL